MQPQHTTQSATQQCNRCLQVKTLEEFGRNVKSPNGRRHICSECFAKKYRASRYRDAPNGMKVCRACRIAKPISEFYLAGKVTFGDPPISSLCIPCTKIKAVKRHEKLKISGPSIIVLSKKCLVCREDKALSEFHMNRRRADWRDSICKPCASIKSREARDPTQKRNYRFLREYGLTSEQVHEMFVKQDFKCWICKTEVKTTGDIKEVGHVDHDHVTGKVRGILCFLCNWRLSAIEHPGFLEKALAYIKEHS